MAHSTKSATKTESFSISPTLAQNEAAKIFPIKTPTEEEEGDGTEDGGAPKRFYPNDFVVQKDKHYPYEWTPNFGSVMDPTHPTLKLEYFKDQADVDWSKWKYEDGLTKDFFVHWGSSSLIKHVQSEDVSLVDRLLVKGQKVANANGISGTITDTNIKTTIQVLGTNHVITDVDATKLKPISPFVRGVEVLYEGTLVGIITHVRRKNVFRIESFGRGKRFTTETIESDGFMKQDPYSSQGINYPGQKTKLSKRQMRNAVWDGKGMNFLWKTGFPPFKYMFSTPDVTFLSVAPIGITVQWLQVNPTLSSSSQANLSSSLDLLKLNNSSTLYIPSSEFSKIEFIGVPSYETIQINSIRLYKLDPNDGSNITSFNSWISGFRSRFMNQPENYYANHFYPPDSIFAALSTKVKNEVPVKVLLKQTHATIEWDDGKTEQMLAADIPIISSPIESRIFRSGTIVTNSFDVEEKNSNKYGIVQLSEHLVSSGSNTLLVKWIEPKELTDDSKDSKHESSSSAGGGVTDLGVQEESIYDLRPHEEYTYYKIHTLVFLKKPKFGIRAGVVSDIDISSGSMRLATHLTPEKITVYPHEIIPLNQRSYWNFFTRKWSVDSMLPHEHQFIIERKVPSKSQEPIALTQMNTNESGKKLKSTLWEKDGFDIFASAPPTHYFYPNELKSLKPGYAKLIAQELQLLASNIPEGIWIRSYEDRIDLLSVLYLGPVDTPYEDGIFLFDIQIGDNFPEEPPKVQFIPYSEPLNPLIATDGTFCVSKLNWEWDDDSRPIAYLGNALLQIQALMFCPQPYFVSELNKANKDTPFGTHFARIYNEKVYINVLTSAINMLKYPHDPWRELIACHYGAALVPKLTLAHKWLKEARELEENQPKQNDDPSLDDDKVDYDDTSSQQSDFSEEENDSTTSSSSIPHPTYPLLPLSKGFRFALTTRLAILDKMLPPGPKITSQLADSGFHQVKSKVFSIHSDSSLAATDETTSASYSQQQENEHGEIIETTEVIELTASD